MRKTLHAIFIYLLATTTLFSNKAEILDCTVNDICADAISINGLSISNPTYTCVQGCNLLANPETTLSGCYMNTQEVVWYTFSSGPVDMVLSLSLNAEESENPTFQIFTGSCSNLIPLVNCVIGHANYASISGVSIPKNLEIYVAVSQAEGEGGDFDLCARFFEDESHCVLDHEISVVSTSLGSPLSGPFQPDETVSFCYTINNYSSAVNVNNCQWLQGIIPIFGPGWSPASFNAQGMPISNSGESQLEGYGATWGWYSDVDYNNAVTTKSVGDFDGDGDLDICHYSEPNCSGTGILVDQIMPPGWYAWNPADGPPSGHPNVDWGSGSGCNNNQGPWTVCFDLITRSADSNSGSFLDTSVKVYTTSDGETGSWTGGISVCSLDFPAIWNGTSLSCDSIFVSYNETTICSSESTNIVLEASQNQPTIFYYEYYSIPNFFISGASSGIGNTISQALINNSDTIQMQIYNVFVENVIGCRSNPILVSVNVYPNLNVNAGNDIVGCQQDTFILGGNPTAMSLGILNYNWSNSSIQNIANPKVITDTSQVYIVIVTDEYGCTELDSVFIEVNACATANFSYTNYNLEYSFENNSVNSSFYHWNFGDNTESDEINPVHIYASDGIYEVTLIAYSEIIPDSIKSQFNELKSDPKNFKLLLDSIEYYSDTFRLTINTLDDLSSIFTSDKTIICASDSIQFSSVSNASTIWEWTFQGGDPSTSTEQFPKVKYSMPGNYDVTLIVSDGIHVSELSIFEYVKVKEKVSSSFIVELVDKQYQFTSTSENADSYYWDFGDNTTSIEMNPLHNFTENGMYHVVLISSNNCKSDTFALELNVGIYPNANFSVNNSDVCAGKTVKFTNYSSENVTNFLWEFEGGLPSTSIESEPEVLYENTGIYNVKLKVSNIFGADSIKLKDFIYVRENPNSNFEMEISGPTVELSPISEDMLTYYWDFGDNSSSTEKKPSHTYAETGNYAIKLTVFDVFNCTSEQTQTAEIIIISTKDLSNYQNAILFPNPSSSGFTIEVDDHMNERINFEIFNSLGQLVHSEIIILQDFESKIIFDKQLEAGIYLISIRNDRLKFVEKLIISQ